MGDRSRRNEGDNRQKHDNNERPNRNETAPNKELSPAPYRARQRQHRGGRGRFRHVYSALDLGTNNCRLLVAKPTKDGFRVIDAFSRIVRLGEGVTASNILSEEAMDRAISALSVCAKKMNRRGVTRARSVATEACRKADNGQHFIDRVARETGIELDIIASKEEARLAATSCAPLIAPDARNALVFDIGGGSTELMWLKVKEGQPNDSSPDSRIEIEAWTSLRDGVVTIAEEYGGFDVTPESYERMVEKVEKQLKIFEQDHDLNQQIASGRVQMIGTSGTVTTLAGVHLNLPRYDRQQVDGLWLSFEQARGVSQRLAEMTYKQRTYHPCIGHQRADLVVAGCAIFEAICRTWPVGELRVADRGLREGILHSLMQDADGEVETNNMARKQFRTE